MKTGILTFHNAVNYGAVLQAYSLQSIIKEMGIDCEIIDYKCPAVERQYRKIKFCERKSVKEFLLSNLTFFFRKNKRIEFKKFLENNIKLSSSVDSIDKLSGFDSVIVGSDQVWNPICTNGDAAFLLKDLKKDTAKLAYAASTGKKENIDLFEKKYKVPYAELLSEFKWISCRESDAAEYIGKIISKKCDDVLDPVLLNDADFWESFCEKNEEKYIFVYNLGNFDMLFKTVKKLKKATNLKVKIINKDIKGDFKTLGYENCSSVSPQEFVSLIKNSSYVVTDSFHATVFSILFHRDFFTIGNQNKNNTNSRLLTLLSEIGLEKQYLIRSDNMNFNKCEFIDADRILNKKRNKSKKALRNALSK